MSVGRGKLLEAISTTLAFVSERIAAATVYYNGQSITAGTAGGIDTQDYEDIVYNINLGTLQGAVATLLVDIYENTTDNTQGSTLVTGASFTRYVTTNDEQQYNGSIIAGAKKRYQWARVESQGEPLTIDLSIVAIMGRADTQATPMVADFDL